MLSSSRLAIITPSSSYCRLLLSSSLSTLYSSSSSFLATTTNNQRFFNSTNTRRQLTTATTTNNNNHGLHHSQQSQSQRRILIIGSGIIGLRTAYEIIQYNQIHNNNNENVHIIIRSPKHPCFDNETTCSIGAGGLWMPFHINDHRVNDWSIQTLHELYPLGMNPKCPFVEIIPTIRLFENHQGINPLHEYNNNNINNDDESYESSPISSSSYKPPPEWTNESILQFQHLTIEMLLWQNNVLKLKIPSESTLKNAGYLHAWLFHPPIVDTIPMLQYLINKINTSSSSNDNNNITIDMNLNTNHYYSNIDEMINDGNEYQCDTIINCTGLGSRTICNDIDMIPVRGILHHYDRNTCIRNTDIEYCNQYHHDNIHDAVITVDEGLWGNHTNPCYMIPRGKHILIGGTCYDNDIEIKNIRDNEYKQLIMNANRLGINTEKCQPISQWIGLRPYRQNSIRCEIDNDTINNNHNNIKLIHNYGYGGSGYTLYVGAAKYVVNELLYK